MSIRVRLLVAALLFSFALCQVADAQYAPGTPVPGSVNPSPTGSTTYTPRSYSVNKAAIGAGVGAAAAGGILFYALRHRGLYKGCVTSDGRSLEGANGKIFQLKGESLQPGEKVSIKAKKDDSDSSGGTLEVEDVRKDLGPCEQRQASTATADHP